MMYWYQFLSSTVPAHKIPQQLGAVLAHKITQQLGEARAGARARALIPDRKNGINLIPSRYHWDQLDAKLIVLDINFPVRLAA
jgi:hypothetical protein